MTAEVDIEEQPSISIVIRKKLTFKLFKYIYSMESGVQFFLDFACIIVESSSRSW